MWQVIKPHMHDGDEEEEEEERDLRFWRMFYAADHTMQEASPDIPKIGMIKQRERDREKKVEFFALLISFD